MKDRLFEAIKKGPADYVEARFEQADRTSIGYYDGELDSVSSNRSTGGIVRACHKGGWGVATFDSLADLDGSVSEACECATLVGAQTTQLADIEGAAVDAEIVVALDRDFRGVALDEKLKLIARYGEIMLRADPAIESSNCHYADVFRTVYFASSRGTYFREDRPYCGVALLATAREGSRMQIASEGERTTRDFNRVVGREPLAVATAKRAVDLLRAPMCPGGRFTVVLDPVIAGVFIHEAFGHLSEADHVYENDKLRKLMYLGRQVGVAGLNVVDDGTMPSMSGSQMFDDEGTPMQRTPLVKNGVLVGHLHSLETAAKMGARPTGNARAGGAKQRPIVRMTNTYIEAGSAPVEDVFAGVDRGVYLCRMFGGTTQMEMFTFSPEHGFLIENGQVGPMIRDIVLSGNVFQTMHNIDAIGDDLLIPERGGACGKGGQAVPVTLGAPHIRVRDVVVGGRQEATA